MQKPLIKYRWNRYSQNGEDGVIEEICRRLGIVQGWFVEFGAWDGKHLSNTYNLVSNHGWQGVYIEADPHRYEALLSTKAEFPERLHTLCARVETTGENKLDTLLARTPLPRQFDLLSVDIDSYDYEVWESLNEYRPKIVLIESNTALRPGVFQRHNPPATVGASFSALVQLGRAKGYQLVCHTGNCIFADNSMVAALQLDPGSLQHPETLFDYGKHLRENVRLMADKLMPKRTMNLVYSLNNKRKWICRKR